MRARVAILGLTSAGCHLIGGAGDYTVRDEGNTGGSSTASQAATTGGTSSAGGSSEGGAPETCIEASCGAYHCASSGLSCLTDCQAHGTADCASGHYCEAGSCVPIKETGSACAGGAECSSSMCVDAVCCASACNGSCESCALAGTEGTCESHAPGTDPDNECGSGVCDGASACAVGGYGWDLTFGSGGDDVYVEHMAADAAGAAVIVGRFTQTIDIDGGSLTAFSDKYSGFVAKVDAQGNHVWSRRFGNGSEDQYVQAVAVDLAGNVVIAGRFRAAVDFGGTVLNATNGKYSAFVVKYDAQGTLLWARDFGNGVENQYAEGVAVDAAGAVTVVGRFRSAVDFGGGALATTGLKYDIFVAHYDAQGNHQWSKGIGNGLQDQYAEAVAADPSGNVVVVGRFFGLLDFGAGSLVSAGAKYDAFAVKYSSNGTESWGQRFGDGASDQYAHGVAIDSAGDVVVAGRYRGSVDFGAGALPSAGNFYDGFAVNYDAAGTHLWSHTFGDGAHDSFGEAVAVDAAGSVVLSGRFRGTVDFGGGAVSSVGGKTDAFVARYHASGAHLWSRTYGNGAVDQQATAVAAGPAGETFTAGMFEGTVDFGSGPTTSQSNKYDGFVVQLTP